jgi:hypothetical protein
MGRKNTTEKKGQSLPFSLLALIKKKKKIFLIYKEFHNGAVAKSCMTNGLLMVKYLRIYFLI